MLLQIFFTPLYTISVENAIFCYLKITELCRWQMTENHQIWKKLWTNMAFHKRIPSILYHLKWPLNTLIYDSSQVWYLSSKVCRAALIIKHLSVFESNFVGFGSCLFKLLNLSTSQARIFAGNQAYHII